MIPQTIEIGPLTLHAYGLIIAFAVLTGWYIAKKRAYLYKIDIKIFDKWILLIPLMTSLIGARTYHILDYWSVYSLHPIEVFNIQNGGIGIWGALIGAIIGFYIVSYLEKISFMKMIDLAAPSLALGQAIGRFGNWINQEGFGPPTTLPWKVYISAQNRPPQFPFTSYYHPTFFYEAGLNLIAFIVLIYLSKKYKLPGQIFGFYLIFYGTIRFLLEFYRIDTWTVGSTKVAQVISAVSLLLGLYLVKRGLGDRHFTNKIRKG